MPTPPVMTSGPVKPPGSLRPHLDVKMGLDWRYQETKRLFVSTGGDKFSPRPSLPKGAEIIPMVPALARADPGTLSEDERNLARFIQVVFPSKAARKKHAADVEGWPCAEEVRWPPEVSLP